ncbi:hypothetical protein KJ758_03480 [Patescibacteria group bacterium]|nr:hypothetical protein [Patescibacteria group bacterium]
MFDDQIPEPIDETSAGEPPQGLAMAPTVPPKQETSTPAPTMPGADLTNDEPLVLNRPAPQLPPQAAPDAASMPAPLIQTPDDQDMIGPKLKKKGFGLKIFLLVVACLSIIAVAGALAYTIIVQPPKTENLIMDTPKDEVKEDVAEPVIEEEEVEVMDTDGDGLTDDEEANFGTNPRLTDTDSDGLNDREEVRVYDTDPLDPDTDADSFLDGEEVINGYNPNGDGKLFDLPK